MNIVIPMSGEDAPFRQAGFPFIKSLTEIRGKPLIEHVHESLRPLHDGRFIFVIRKEDAARSHLDRVLELLTPGAQVLKVEGATAGAACTCLMAIDLINDDDELVITNGDQLIQADLHAAIADFRERNLDGATIVFESIHPRWSYVRINDDQLVVEAAEKRPISRLATAGFYYFKHGKDFVEGALNMIRKDAHVSHQFYVCPVFNEMLLKQKKIGVYQIPQKAYISLATPQGVQMYEEMLARKEG